MSHSLVPARPTRLPRSVRRARTGDLFAELHGPARSVPAREAELIDELVLTNAQVALALARRFRGRGVDLEDLEQVACLALVRAVRGYDSSRGSDFLLYAVPVIVGQLRCHFRDQGWSIRVPRRIQEAQRRLAREDAPAVGESYGNAQMERLADRTGVSVEDVDAALTARGCYHPASLDVERVANAGRRGQLIADEDPGFDALDARLVLEPLLVGMPWRDRHVLHLRYVEERSQREIGQDLGVSQVQVSRLLARIHQDLRHRLDLG